MPADAPQPAPPEGEIRLLADRDFAPFSFQSSSGAPSGLTVELALAACKEARLTCSVETRPFAELLPALGRGEAEAILTGPKLDEAAFAAAVATRPYFRQMGRFAVAAGSEIAQADAEVLRRRQIGVVKDTLHARWLEAYFSASRIVTFPSLAEAGTELRDGKLDAIFGDNLQVIYWTAGEVAAGCCRLLGGAFSDWDHFSRNLAILVRRDRADVLASLDYGLDMAQKSGATARIISAYVPLPVW